MVRNDILQKLRRYCAYQERCHEEVRTKLLSLKVYGAELEETIAQLVQEDFLNEERFAKAYAGGKFRIQKWGRVKILQELKKRKVSDYCIRKGMQEIPETEYRNSLQKIVKAAGKRYKSKSDFNTSGKIAAYAIGRGFEPELVWQEVRAFIS